ncbi:hypothetical protein M6B38_193985 [Iris pallida]|uniref:Uncharacterized protein n=1 Tax=Iris pallida TaxID=29817 RepID=A0AAX6EDZ9_IRIPA|nr:hypothetical protein M6B38_193985 [Iris pallida]
MFCAFHESSRISMLPLIHESLVTHVLSCSQSHHESPSRITHFMSHVMFHES